ncbi:hypothetical protein GCM10027188_09580 [Lysobacter humi (ex Lee et al. 2017)]
MDPQPTVTQFDAESHAFIRRVLATARGYLGGSLSFMAEIVGAEKVVRDVDAASPDAPLRPGMRFPREDSYCHHLLCGQIPEAVYDARHDPRTRALALTASLDIDAYMGVPVRLPGGRALGTLCCINFAPQPEHRERDVAFLRFLAELIGEQLQTSTRANEDHRARIGAMRALIDRGEPRIVYQRIVALDGAGMTGVEALARFPTAEGSPEPWFREAWSLGLGVEVELAAIRSALAGLAQLPAGAYLSVNASPATVAAGGFGALFDGLPLERIVVEITEHDAVDDYARLLEATQALRAQGLRIAIDDVGAGYASLRHVLLTDPHIVKLDMSLTRGIDADIAKQALVRGMVAFAAHTGITLVAEGVETVAEAEAMRAIGVTHAQGYLFHRPGAIAD